MYNVYYFAMCKAHCMLLLKLFFCCVSRKKIVIVTDFIA